MRRKLLLTFSLIVLVLGTSYAQVVFDPAAVDTSTLPDKMSVVDIGGTKYLKVILNSWSSYVELNPDVVIAPGHTRFRAKVKYSVGTSGYTIDQINTFLKLSTPGWAQLCAKGSASSATFKDYTIDGLTPGATVGVFQVAGQNTVNWGAVSNDTMFIGRIIVENPAAFLDPAVVDTATLPNLWSVVDITGEKYFRIILNGWSSFWEFYKASLTYTVPANVTAFKTMAKYSVGTSGYTIDQINTFLKFSTPGWAEVVSLGAASSSTFKKYGKAITGGSELGVFQVGGQNTVNWGAVSGDTLWVGIVLPDMVDSLKIYSQGGATIIDTDKGTLQFTDTVYPADVANPSVTWSVSDEELATISGTGLLKAIANGVVTVKATANDGSGKFDEIDITISNQAAALQSKMVITHESFGNKSWDTDYPGTRPTGFNKHWKWTDVNTFTSVNGHIEAGGDSSIRIMSYDEGWAQDYPGATPIHKVNLTNNATYSGSWDTMYFAGIDISKALVTGIEFGYCKARRQIHIQNTASLNVQFRIDGGAWIQLDTSLIDNDTLTSWYTWQFIELPVANLEGDTMDILFYGLTTEQVYVDDIRVIGDRKPLGIAKETFGDKSWDTDYPGTRPTGFAKHWKWTDVNTFTSNNGHIEAGGDSSIRIMSYDDSWTQDYPGATPIHKVNLTNNSAYSGSWDTLKYVGIDITNFALTSIDFGYCKARRVIHVQDTASLNVQYRIDGGAWVQLDTSLISNDTLNWYKWQYIQLPLDNVEGQVLDILFYGLTTEQVYIDDIMPVGILKPRGIAKETFGNKSWDTDYPGTRPTGFNKHWKWTDVNTFTSTNGHIEAGNDSSIRIMSYDDSWTQDYPGATPIHKVNMTNNSAYSGSWDTLIYTGIDITDSWVTGIEFGYCKARRTIHVQDTASLNVQYRIDGGDWVQLDTSVIDNDTLTSWFTWQYIQMPIENARGTTLDILFYGLTTEQVYVDDIAAIGFAPLFAGKLVESITVTSEGGAVVIDTKGGTLQMYAAISPEDATDTTVTWIVSDPTKASIDENGLLTAKGDGVITVTARSNDGGLVEGTLDVTITNQVWVESIIVIGAGAKTQITVDDGTLQMVAILTPSNASIQDVEWSVDLENIATISETGLLTAVSNGIVAVTATSPDAGGASGTANITISGQVGVKDITDRSLAIFPNPVKSDLYIQNAGSINSFEILNVDGKLMMKIINHNDLAVIDVSGLQNGLYVIRGYTGSTVYYSKFVKE